MIQDLVFGFRQLRRNPGFTLVAASILALGLGASSFVFSLVDSVLLAAPPYPEPGRLVSLRQSLPAVGEIMLGVSPPEFLDYRDRNQVFSGLAAYEPVDFDLTSDQRAERIHAMRATSNLFRVLLTEPRLGRVFSEAEDHPGAPRVAILSDAYWKSHFAANPSALGSSIRLNEQPYTVIGVMPAGFRSPGTVENSIAAPAVWIPMAYTSTELSDRASSFDSSVIGRLKPGVSVGAAAADVKRVAQAFQREHPDIYSGNVRLTVSLETLGSSQKSKAAPVLWLFSGAVAFVLLIACANVAGLLLARTGVRAREIAVRSSLGASSLRIARQVFTETLLLCALGAGLGLTLAQGLALFAAKEWSGTLETLGGLRLNPLVVSFSALLAFVTAALCSLGPLRAWLRFSLADTLKQSGRGATASSRNGRFHSALVVLEAASAVVLLIAAGLLLQSFSRLLQVSPGFDPKGVLIVRTSFNRQRYPSAERRRTTEQLILRQLASLPGVDAAALTTHVPLADERQIGFTLEDKPNDAHWADNALVSGGYFSAMGIPLLRGRVFGPADQPNTPGVAVINQSMARRYWPGRDPLGQRVFWGGRALTVIGTVGDVHLKALDLDAGPSIYTSVFQTESGVATSGVFILRSSRLGPQSLASTARQVIASVDAGVPVFATEVMSGIVAESLATRRFIVQVLTAFAFVALALTLIGLYALLAYTVAQRTAELGVRIALGARPDDVARMIALNGFRLIGAGIALGLIGAAIASPALSSMLYGVASLDPLTYLAVTVLLVLVALIAAYLPARRAARVDPIVALRYE